LNGSSFKWQRNCTFDNSCKVYILIGNQSIIIKLNQTLLSNLNVLNSRKKSQAKVTRSSKIFKTIINAIQEKKGEHIVSLDLKKIPEAVADFFIICQANNNNQLRAIADNVEEEVKKHCGESAYKHEGRQAEQWILIDYVNIVIHVMLPEPRKFYQLEELWSDAQAMEHLG
jgi:ribosome-associated protein